MEFFTALYKAIISIFESVIGDSNGIFNSIKSFFDTIFGTAE